MYISFTISGRKSLLDFKAEGFKLKIFSIDVFS